MKTLLLSLVLFTASFSVSAKDKKPIADETFISVSGEKNIKVQCSNAKITAMVLQKFDSIILSYSVSYKKDRMGRYKEFTIYFSNEYETIVTNFLKSL